MGISNSIRYCVGGEVFETVVVVEVVVRCVVSVASLALAVVLDCRQALYKNTISGSKATADRQAKVDREEGGRRNDKVMRSPIK